MKRIVLLCALICGLVLVAPVIAGQAMAHSWYSGKTDPVYGGSCCGGTDCAQFIITRENLTAEDAGLRVRLTAAEARRINPYTAEGINAVVTWDRVQPSEDGNWHICIMTVSRSNERGGIYCLFAPPNI